MPEQIYTYTAEEVARMLKSGELRLLTAPEPAQKEKTVLEPSLIMEWEKQAKKLADLFAKELNQSKDQYMEDLPKFFPQPESYKGRFDSPLIVQTPTEKLTLVRMLQIAGVANHLDLRDVNDWEEDPGKFKTPKTSYITWLHDGSINKDSSVADVRKNLVIDERGGTVFDGLGLFIQNPDILKSHSPDLPGSQYGPRLAPCLHLLGGRPWLRSFLVGNASFRWGSVVAGRDIGT